MIVHFSSKPTRSWLLAGLVWVLAGIGLLQAEISRVHLDLKPDWFAMSFYFFLPALLWTFLFPFVKHLQKKYPLAPSLRPWLTHILLSLLIAGGVRMVSLWIDFSIKRQLGIIDQSPAELFPQIKFLIVSSLLDQMVVYWLMVLFIRFFIVDEPLVQKPKPHLDLKTNAGFIKVLISEIYYIEAFGNYLKVHTSTGCYLTRKTIKSMLTELGGHFYQVHRSFVVNGCFVVDINHFRQGRYVVKMANKAPIATGINYRNSVRALRSYRQMPPLPSQN